MMNPGIFAFRGRLLPAVMGIVFVAGSFASNRVVAQNVPLELPDGFSATRFADDSLATNVQSMTTNAEGQIVVSGPGYIRTLVDEDGDGVADNAIEYADQPSTGAQGLFADGSKLYAVGDAGLIQFVDENGDGTADGAPNLLFRCKTGGEHTGHAVRKGPDGCWYLILGNSPGVDESLINEPTSPIRDPHGGLLLRFSEDFNVVDVLSDGFRNAYDFDFNAVGDLFTYDSDGERDISLPWYRPTRVFNTIPGFSQGWVSRSWKRPNYYLSMSPTIVENGRGSPTGVVCYQHNRFPEEFRNTLFVLDWTYGRITAVKMKRKGASWEAQARDFAKGSGSYGFAPTDAVVGKDGAIYVSVGGRGTQGAIYRIAADKADSKPVEISTLDDVLNAPQPYAAWSRALWEPVARQLGEEKMIRAGLNDDRPVHERLRALEILTDLFQGPDVDYLRTMTQEESRELRARTVWAYGRTVRGVPDPYTLKPYLVDESPVVVRNALGVLIESPAESLAGFENEIAGCLAHEDHVVRFLAARAATRMTDSSFREVGEIVRTTGWAQSILMAWAFVDRGYVGHPYGWSDIGTAALERLDNPTDQLNAVLLIQHSLGGFGDSPAHAPVFDGYLPRIPLDQEEERVTRLVKAMEGIYPTGQQPLDRELARLTAMISAESPVLFEKILDQITGDSDPVMDLHHLIVLATMPVPRETEQTEKIATALLQLHEKYEARDAQLDRNWEPRVKEMYESLVARDGGLPNVISNHQKFGRPEHDIFVGLMQGEAQERALAHYTNAVQKGEIELTVDLLTLLSEKSSPVTISLAREAVNDERLDAIALEILAEKNAEQDRNTIRDGLASPELDLAALCLEAMNEWEQYTPHDLGAVVQLLDRLDEREGVEIFWQDTLASLETISAQLLEQRQQEAGPPIPDANGAENPLDRPSLVKAWREWTTSEFPEAANSLRQEESSKSWADWSGRLAEIDWEAGDVAAGKIVYEKKQCGQCHDTRSAVGPSLEGITARFSRSDLFEAIVAPNKEVSPRYRSTMITTAAGKTYTGIVVYESVDGLLLRDTSHRTVRIEADEIEFRKRLKTSLMPEELLKDCDDKQLADLYAFLKQLDEG